MLACFRPYSVLYFSFLILRKLAKLRKILPTIGVCANSSNITGSLAITFKQQVKSKLMKPVSLLFSIFGDSPSTEVPNSTLAVATNWEPLLPC